MIFVLVLLVGIWYVLVQLPYWRGNCGDVKVEMEDFSVDEWGIFKQDYNTENGTYMIGPRPGIVPRPDVVEEEECKPVIYFHGDGELGLTINISLDLEDVTTIPEADVDAGGISWDVVVAGDINDGSDDAKVVTGPDESFEYLFYEGRGRYYQNLMAKVVEHSGNIVWGRFDAKIQNIGTYDMEDLYIIYDRGDGTRFLHYALLGPGETINDTVGWSQWTNISELRGMLKEDLTGRNLTNREAEDLLDYWVDGDVDENGMKVDETLLEIDEGDFDILYLLPQKEYDHKLPIDFSRDPTSMNRVGICYITGIPMIHVR